MSTNTNGLRMRFDLLNVYKDDEVLTLLENASIEFSVWPHGVVPTWMIQRLANARYRMAINNLVSDREARKRSLDTISQYGYPVPLLRTQWGFITGAVYNTQDHESGSDAQIRCHEIAIFSNTLSARNENLNQRVALSDYFEEILGEDSNIDVRNTHELPAIAQIAVRFERHEESHREDELAAQFELKQFLISLLKNHSLAEIMINGLPERNASWD